MTNKEILRNKIAMMTEEEINEFMIFLRKECPEMFARLEAKAAAK